MSGSLPNITYAPNNNFDGADSFTFFAKDDDFAVSNVSNILGIKIIPLMTKGIKIVGKWIFYCPACKVDFPNEKECLMCGNKLKKKLVKV